MAQKKTHRVAAFEGARINLDGTMIKVGAELTATQADLCSRKDIVGDRTIELEEIGSTSKSTSRSKKK